MELQVGDHITDETGEWEMIAPPYRTAGGRVVHARVQRINEPASWEIRSAGILGFASTEAIGRPCTSPGALPGPNPTTGVPSWCHGGAGRCGLRRRLRSHRGPPRQQV